MKTKNFFLFIVVFLPLAVLGQFELKGKIVEKSNGLTLAGAHISIQQSTEKQISDTQGRFNFAKLNQGTYTLIISYIGYKTTTETIVLQRDTEVEIELESQAYLRDEVVVAATRIQEKSPISYSTVSREMLQQENTGADLPYLMQSTPSLVVSSDAGSGVGYTSLRIRGTDLTRINVTLNGIPVNDAESHSVYFVDLPDLASSIDNIQVQRGVGTSTNGAAAFGASINIQTDTRSATSFAELSSAAGSFNTYKNTLSFGTGISEKGFSLDGRLSKITSDGYIDRAASDLKSFYLNGTWSNSKTLVKAVVIGGYESTYQAWYGIPKDSLETNRTYNPAGEMLNSGGEITGYYDNQTDNYQQDYYQLHIAHQLDEALTFTGSAFLTKGMGYYESWKNDAAFSDYGFSDVIIGGDTITSTDLVQQKWLDNRFYGFNAALMYEKQKLNAVIGTGWNQYDGDHFGYITWAQFASESMNDTKWYDNTGLKTDYHIFVKATYQIQEKLMLFGDLQWRNIHYDMKGTHDDLGDLTQSHDFSFLNPKTGLFYNLNSNHGVYVSFAISNREPNRSVYRDADLNQEITHETLYDYEAGYKFENKKLKLESNIFYMDYKNQLVLTGKINNVGSAILTNVPVSYRLGWETMLSYQLSKKLTLTSNLTLSENKIIDFVEYVDNWNYWDDPETEPYQYTFEHGNTVISFSPSITAGASINWKISENVNFAYQSNYVGKQYLDNTSNDDRSLDAYHIGNIRMQANIPQKLFRKASLQLHLNNVFNHSYESNGWVYRYYWGGESYQMDGYFPQAGINWMMQLNLGI